MDNSDTDAFHCHPADLGLHGQQHLDWSLRSNGIVLQPDERRNDGLHRGVDPYRLVRRSPQPARQHHRDACAIRTVDSRNAFYGEDRCRRVGAGDGTSCPGDVRPHDQYLSMCLDCCDVMPGRNGMADLATSHLVAGPVGAGADTCRPTGPSGRLAIGDRAKSASLDPGSRGEVR